MTLEDQAALVTGSGQGIEPGIVLYLAKEGADVAINYRSHPKGAKETLEKGKAIGDQCYRQSIQSLHRLALNLNSPRQKE